MSKNVIAFDTESFYSDDYSIKTLGTARYCRDPLFDVYMISVSDGEKSWAGHPRDFNWDCLNGATVLSHNAAHDRTVVGEMQKRGLAPEIKPENWYCTANMAACLCNRRDLERASEFLLGVRLVKDARAAAKGKHYADMERDGSAQKMLEYARGDALYCHQLFTQHGHRWSQFERDVSEQTVQQALRGVQIDVEKLNEYYRIVHTALATMTASLPWVREGKKTFSPKAVAEECRRLQIPSPPVKAHDGGQEAFLEWYNTYMPKVPWIRTFSDIRSVGMLLTTLEKIRERIDENGILHFGLYYFGSHTGRNSGSGGINMLNLRKAPYFFGDDGLPRAEESECEEIERAFSETGQYPGWVRHVVDIRSLFIARPGKKLIIADLSQIEPRVLAKLCGDNDALNKMAAGLSPYQVHAELTMGWKGGDLKDLIEKKGDHEAKKVYALAKARVLGLGYQCAWEKFVTVAWTMANLDVTEDDPEFCQAEDRITGDLLFNPDKTPKMVSGYGHIARQTVKDFRRSNPKIVALWKALDTGYKNSCGSDFTVELPSGRKMIYRDVKEEWGRFYDEDLKRYRKRRVVKAEIVKGGRVLRDALYGGLITENITQATAREIFAEHCLELDKQSGIDVLFGVYDEAVNECDIDVTEEDVRQIMSKPPEWMPDCPVKADVKTSNHYLK